MLADEDAKKYIDGIAVHWYWDSLYPASTLDSTHFKFPDKFLLGTEACVGTSHILINVIFVLFFSLFYRRQTLGD
jgi:O-glycosyl hydrolase